MMQTEKLKLVSEWDKTFPKSEKVNYKKVTFINRYGISLAADMYIPKNVENKLPAIAVSGPFGAVKEQCSGLYAQTMAERGYLTIAFDPSFTGESGGIPRYMASPDINTEDFMAAVDFLSVQDYVDADKIAIIGICGWGGMALNAAALDTRLNSNDGWNSIGCQSFMNQPILKYSNEIRSAVLIMHGEKAHSFYFGKDAYDAMIQNSKYTENKELLVIPGAVHTDLYDNIDVIPFDKMDDFFKKNM